MARSRKRKPRGKRRRVPRRPRTAHEVRELSRPEIGLSPGLHHSARKTMFTLASWTRASSSTWRRPTRSWTKSRWPCRSSCSPCPRDIADKVEEPLPARLDRHRLRLVSAAPKLRPLRPPHAGVLPWRPHDPTHRAGGRGSGHLAALVACRLGVAFVRDAVAVSQRRRAAVSRGQASGDRLLPHLAEGQCLAVASEIGG